jgi:hypothetical protein
MLQIYLPGGLISTKVRHTLKVWEVSPPYRDLCAQLTKAAPDQHPLTVDRGSRGLAQAVRFVGPFVAISRTPAPERTAGTLRFVD